MMDLRYHLASLMSVFLALAVGIVVGVSLGSSERQAGTIRNLQRDVAAIRAEDSRLKEVNAELRRLLATREEAQADLLPLAVRGRLSGNRVALLLAGNTAALAAPVAQALRLAGADLVMTVRLPREEATGPETAGINAEAPHVSRRGVAASAPPAALAPPDEAGRVAGSVARALIEGRPGLLEGVRDRIADLQMSGDGHLPVRRLLLLCPNDDPEYARQTAAGRGVEAAVARIVREADAILVAAEPEEGRMAALMSGARPHESVSLLPALTGLGAGTVDHIDTAVGQIAAVLALAGARGNFGTGPAATRALPPLQ